MDKEQDNIENVVFFGVFIITSAINISIYDGIVSTIIIEICLAGIVFLLYAEKEYAKKHPIKYLQANDW